MGREYRDFVSDGVIVPLFLLRTVANSETKVIII